MADSKDKNEHLDDSMNNSSGGQEELDDLLSQIKEGEGAEPVKREEAETEEIIRKPIGDDQPEDLESLLSRIEEKEDEPAESMNFFQRLIGVVVNPAQTFEYLRVKPDWILPAVLTILITVVFAYLTYDIIVDSQIAKMEENSTLEADQKDAIIDSMEQGKYGVMRNVQIFGITPLTVLIVLSLVAVAYLVVGTVLLGGKATFKQMLSIVSYPWLVIQGIFQTLVVLPLMLQSESMSVYPSLAALLPSSMEDDILFKFINSFDIFNVWFLVVLGIGLSVLLKMPRGKSILTVFAVFVVWKLITVVGLGSFTAQFGL